MRRARSEASLWSTPEPREISRASSRGLGLGLLSPRLLCEMTRPLASAYRFSVLLTIVSCVGAESKLLDLHKAPYKIYVATS